MLCDFVVPSAPPESVQIGIVNETTAFVKWLPPKAQQLNGVLQGYKVFHNILHCLFSYFFKVSENFITCCELDF